MIKNKKNTEVLIDKVKLSELNNNIKSELILEVNNFYQSEYNNPNKGLFYSHKINDSDKNFISSIINTFINNHEFINRELNNFNYDIINKLFRFSIEFQLFQDTLKNKNREINYDINKLESKINQFLKKWNEIDNDIIDTIKKMPNFSSINELDEWMSCKYGKNSKIKDLKEIYKNLVNTEKVYTLGYTITVTEEESFLKKLKSFNKPTPTEGYSREYKDINDYPIDFFKYITRELYLNIPKFSNNLNKEKITLIFTNLLINEYNKFLNDEKFIMDFELDDIRTLIKNIKL
jgi:hypothetical protein